MRGTGASHYAAVLPKIMWANNSGFRLVLPSCFRVPLGEERAMPIVAQADGRTAHSESERDSSSQNRNWIHPGGSSDGHEQRDSRANQ